jgi:hypothetical protein
MRTIFITISLISFTMATGADFTSRQQTIIYSEAINTIRKYDLLLNTLAGQSVDITAANKTGEKLIELFIARKALVYNDLDPAHQLSEFYELDTYVANLQLWYPDGLKSKIDFDKLKAGTILKHEENVYTVDILISKELDGNYINKTRNTNTENLLFRIAFYQDGSTFKGFKIAGIRSTKSKTTNDSRILTEVRGQNIDEKDMVKIKNQIQSLVNDYVNYLNLLADPKEPAEDKEFYKTSFVSLFDSAKASLANDIEPKPEKRWLNTSDYLQNYMQSYPEGIRNLAVNVDSAKFGKVIPGDKNKFSITIDADKFFSGKYKDKTIVRENSKVSIKIGFVRDENTFTNFRFEGIDRFQMNLNNQQENNITTELPQIAISSLNRKGFYIGVAANYDLVKLYNPSLLDHSYYDWQTTSENKISPSLVLRYYAFNKLGIETGLTIDNYKTHLTLNGNFTRPDSLYDDNYGYWYNQQIKAQNYDSTLSYSYLRVPFTFIFHTNSKPEKMGFFVKAGVCFSYLLSAGYTTSAENLSNPRFYHVWDVPDANTYLYNEGDNYYEKPLLHTSGIPDTKKLNVSVTGGAGISIPLGYFATLEAGPEIVYGISDIYTQKTVTDFTGTSSPAKKVHFLKYGIRIGLNYKF